MEIKINEARQGYLEYEDMQGNPQFVCVTEWANGEGYDISFSDNKLISLHNQDINTMMAVIRYMEV